MPANELPWTSIAAAAGGVVLLWLAAGGALHWLDRRLDRRLGARDERAGRPRRARVSRPFEADPDAGPGLAPAGRVRIGVEIWRARCAEPLAGELRVGDRVWVRPAGANRVTVVGRADPIRSAGDRGDERNREWTTDTSC